MLGEEYLFLKKVNYVVYKNFQRKVILFEITKI